MKVVRDLKLDNTSGDLVVTDDVQLVGDSDAVRQAVWIGLRFFQGEWFLDESVGIPYFTRVFVKNANAYEVRQYVRLAILDAPDVDSVTKLVLTSDNARRTLGATFTAKMLDGTALSEEVSS